MKYFYKSSVEEGALDQEAFTSTVQQGQLEGSFVVNASVASAMEMLFQFSIGTKLPHLSDSNFQLSDTRFISIDAKGVVQAIKDRPDWYKSESEINNFRLLNTYQLSDLSFLDAIQKLSKMRSDEVTVILTGLLPNLKLTQPEASGEGSVHTDKKPRVQNLTAEQFEQFYKLMTSAVKDKQLPSMGYFIKHGVTDADLKRGFRTYYKIVAGQNMKPDNFTPGDAYFAEIRRRLDAIKNEGVDRSYNAISSNLSKLDEDLPISELTYKFNDGGSL
ncbi:hypothetical protein [Enterobacter roggenkampii]|uniref:hypothetical protein n=1 Tax=Enterobacter roggenkampii TaxID=1812935 RepID=UPI002FE6BE22